MWSQGVTDPLASTVFEFGVTSVQRADADREGEVERFLAAPSSNSSMAATRNDRPGMSAQSAVACGDRAWRTVDAEHVSGRDAGNDLTRGGAWSATDLKNP